MARRPTSERVLTKTELLDYSRKLLQLDPHGVQQMYQGAYADCRLDEKRFPSTPISNGLKLKPKPKSVGCGSIKGETPPWDFRKAKSE
jgi:hypothetical protein